MAFLKCWSFRIFSGLLSMAISWLKQEKFCMKNGENGNKIQIKRIHGMNSLKEKYIATRNAFSVLDAHGCPQYQITCVVDFAFGALSTWCCEHCVLCRGVSSLQANNAHMVKLALYSIFSKVSLLSLVWLLCKGCSFSSILNAWPIYPATFLLGMRLRPKPLQRKMDLETIGKTACGTSAYFLIHWSPSWFNLASWPWLGSISTMPGAQAIAAPGNLDSCKCHSHFGCHGSGYIQVCLQPRRLQPTFSLYIWKKNFIEKYL